MNYFIPFFILFLSACSTFKPRSFEESFKQIQLEGEGRGRLGYVDQSFLFRFESVFKEKNWLLNISIPMHGQETLVFEDLHLKNSQGKMQAFEKRIDREIKEKSKLKQLQTESIVTHLRSLVRFIEARSLGLKVFCEEQLCTLEEEEFEVNLVDDGIVIRKLINQEFFVEFNALYLKEDHYSRTNFYLKKEGSRDNLFSLELFWQNK